MKIEIICVGKLKETFYRTAVSEYLKRLSAFVKVEIIETMEISIPDKASDKECAILLNKEGDVLLNKIKKDTWCIVLDVKGKSMDSVDFSRALNECMISGQSHFTFIIGGSLGISQAVKNRAQLLLSLSDMTFTHQMTRIILLEQIYRAFCIINNRTYHK